MMHWRYRVSQVGERYRRDLLPMLHFGADSLAWALAITAAWWIRFDFRLDRLEPVSIALMTAIAITAQASAGWMFGLYRRRWRYGSFDEFTALAASVATAGLVLLGVNLIVGIGPNSTPISATAFAILLTVAGRSSWRMYRGRRNTPVDAEPVIIIGAGDGGEQICRALLSDRHAPYLPVGFVDDDPAKARLRILGVRVLGTIDQLDDVARRTGVATVLFAVPSAGQQLRHRVAQVQGLHLLSLPSVAEMFNEVSIADIAPITVEELLGHPPAEIDIAAIAAYVTGRRVLVTGAGGSIGSELCRQLAGFDPAALIMLDRDESGLHATQLGIAGHGLLDDPNLVLADLRDRWRVDEVMATYRPEVVFHAAALKHLTLLENHPVEAWKTNVDATQNLLESATRYGVQRFVNISTDKAADPTCVLGYSKRITERLTAAIAVDNAGVDTGANAGAPLRYLSVRFGNVLGSRGSVLEAFDAQARHGGPITLTDRAVTRYFMTIAEAVTLTIYAGAIGSNGQVLVLDMGDPVPVLQIAERYARRADPPLEIIETGLRPGEKLHEVLLGVGEVDERPVHPLISHLDVPPLAFAVCCELWANAPKSAATPIEVLAQMCAAGTVSPPEATTVVTVPQAPVSA